VQNGSCIPERVCDQIFSTFLFVEFEIFFKECPPDVDPTTTPKPLECERNEEYSDCGTRCGQMCSDIGKQIICPKKGLCVSIIPKMM